MDFLLKLLGRSDVADHNWVAAARLVVATLAAVPALVVALAAGASTASAVSIGYDVGTLVFLVLVWQAVARRDAAATQRLARTEDLSRPFADLLLLTASVASLVAVGFLLVDAGRGAGSADFGLVALSVIGLVLGWTLVHTVYMLRYARLYYGQPQGGIAFEERDPPDYYDFAYLAFTIGMTYQVSDTGLTTKRLRRTVIRHALLSYLFGALIVAVTINLVGSLLTR